VGPRCKRGETRTGHTSTVIEVTFSPDRRTLATVSSDRTPGQQHSVVAKRIYLKITTLVWPT
jgi:hypothetical protein